MKIPKVDRTRYLAQNLVIKFPERNTPFYQPVKHISWGTPVTIKGCHLNNSMASGVAVRIEVLGYNMTIDSSFITNQKPSWLKTS